MSIRSDVDRVLTIDIERLYRKFGEEAESEWERVKGECEACKSCFLERFIDLSWARYIRTN